MNDIIKTILMIYHSEQLEERFSSAVTAQNWKPLYLTL